MRQGIKVVNVDLEDCSNEPNYYYVGGKIETNVLANPFSIGKSKSIKKRTFKTRDEAVNAYRAYFRLMYGADGMEAFTSKIDEIYRRYKNGETIYLACHCHPKRCHADIIGEELQMRFLREARGQEGNQQ